MNAAVASRTMARKKGSPTVQVRIPATIVEMATIVAAFEGRQPGEVIAEIVQPHLEKRHAEHVAAAAERLADKSSPAPRRRKGEG